VYSHSVMNRVDELPDIPQPAEVILALQQATHATLRVLTARLAEHELAPSEINILACLGDGKVRAVSELATETGTKPTTLTSVLNRLVGRGFVVRDLDTGDRRSFLLSLTGAGFRAAVACRSAMAAIEGEALAGLDPAALAGFYQVTHALTEVSQ
jgi:MarR family transcriptional regulator, organic hydroperoxide resistance regulator